MQHPSQIKINKDFKQGKKRKFFLKLEVLQLNLSSNSNRLVQFFLTAIFTD